MCSGHNQFHYSTFFNRYSPSRSHYQVRAGADNIEYRLPAVALFAEAGTPNDE
jgi:hypothetical protein